MKGVARPGPLSPRGPLSKEILLFTSFHHYHYYKQPCTTPTHYKFNRYQYIIGLSMATIVRAQDISTKTLPDSLHCRNQELARVHAHCPPYTNWRACIPELLENALLAVNILCVFLCVSCPTSTSRLLQTSGTKPMNYKILHKYIYIYNFICIYCN